MQQGSRAWTYTYDTSGRLSEVHAPLGKVTSYGYDAADRLTSVTLPDGRQVGYSYDAAGNLTSVTPPGRTAHAFAFSPVDLPTSYAPPATGDGGSPTTFTYNADRQLTSATRPDGSSLTVAYDGAGRAHTVTADNGDSRTLGYDAQTGQLSSTASSTGEDLAFQYDGPLATTDSLSGPVHGDVVRTYDNNFRLASLAVGGTTPIPYGYDQDGLLTQVGSMSVARTAATGFVSGSALGGSGTSRTYDTYGTATSTSSSYGGTQLLGESLNMDDLGRIGSKTETVQGVATSYGYTYDTGGRLTDVSKDGVPAAHYTYDDNGNRTAKTAGDATLNATYDAQDRLTTYGQNNYTYTRNGELKSKTDSGSGDVTSYAYDGFGDLNRVDLPGGTRIDYLLDGQGRRVGKKIDGALAQGFLYGQGVNPLAELDASGSVRSVFVYGADGTTASYMLRDGNTYRIFSDERGSVRMVVDVATGDIAQKLAYDEFGNVTEDTNPGFQPFGYAGGLYDRQTKLTRFGARDYDAETGRFTTKDPLGFGGGDTNLYGYGLNDPINTVDPAGTSFFDDVSNAAAGLLDGATGGLSTDLAGALLDFNPDCADFGTAGDIGIAVGTIGSMFYGAGEAGLGARAASGGASRVARAADGAGEYLARKAPPQVTPGTRVLQGIYKNNRGRVEPWEAHYDEYGRLVGRTDHNAGNKADGIPDIHHHVYEYGPGYGPQGHEVISHAPGPYRP